MFYMNDLFNPKTVKKLCSNIEISSEQEEAAKEWLNLLKKGLLKDEKNNYFKFAEIILKRLLGYDIINDMSHEKGNIEFSFKNKKGKTVLGIEVKGTGKDLFTEQKGYKEWQKTPIHQLWNYMGELSLDYGIATNYKHFVLIGRKGTSATHYFNFEEIRDDKEKLKEFIAIFSKEQIINKGFIEELEKASAIEEREFTKEFYKLFNETRLMLVKEFQENGTNKDEAIHYSQLFLNRLMFIFFAEDTHKLKARIFENSVISILKAEMLILDESHQVSNIIVNLFKSLDAGSERFSIFGFNGGLFKDEVPSNIFFNDLRDKEFFKDVYQNSKLKKEMKLDDVSKSIFDKYQNKLNPIISNLILMALFDFKTEISVNILGHVFEQSLSDLEVLKEGEVSKRKKEGVFYTPEYITDYICRNTIIPYLSKENARNPYDLILEYSSNIEDLESKLNHIKIVDPACGSGAFLIKAVDVLLELFKEIQIFKQREGAYTSVKRGRKKIKDEGQFTFEKWHEEDEAKEIIKNNIYGVDINEESVEITKLSLFLKIARSGEKLIDLSKNIKCGNSLIDDSEVDSKAFNWKQEFKEIFYKGGFDIVVGNPPYIFAREKISELEKSYYSENYYSAQYQVNTYLLFIEQTLKLLIDKGHYGLIVPNAWLMVSSAKNLRETVLNNSNVDEIINLSGYSFEGVSVETIIIIAHKGLAKSNEIKVKLSSGETFNFSHTRNQDDFLQNEGFELKVFSDNISERLTEKIKQNSEILNDITNIKAGLKAYEVGKGNPKQTREDVNNRPYDYSYKFDDDTHRYLDGKDVGRYWINWSNLYLRYGEHLAAPRTFDIFRGDKIIIREITGNYPKSIIATFSDEIYLFNMSNIAVVEKENSIYSLKYILVILNSSLMSYYFVKNTPKSVRQMFPKIILRDLRLFPIKKSTVDEQKPFIEKSNLVLELNKEYQKIKTKFLNRAEQNLNLGRISNKLYNFYELSFKDFVKELKKQKINISLKGQDEWEEYFNKYKKELLELKEQINKTDREIDEMVYNLYGLTEEERNIVNELQM